MGILWDILRGAGNLADLPGSSVRDILALRNPVDQWATPFSDENRATGRDVLRQYGLAGEEDTGLNAAGGMATEMALDPLTWLGAGALFKALRGAGKAASATGAAGRAVQRTGLQQALSRAATPATAYSVASPVAGAYLMGDNPEGAAWKNYVGAGLMVAPLVLGMAKGMKRLAGASKAAIPETFTSTRQVKNSLGKWEAVTKPADILASDELKEALSVWDTAGTTRPAHFDKYIRDARVVRGEIAASRDEQIESAKRIMENFPATHAWKQRAAVTQQEPQA